jgi:hypothetical protein
LRVNEEILERKVAALVYKTEINDLGDPPRLPRDTPLAAKCWHYISPKSGGRSVGIVRSRTKGRPLPVTANALPSSPILVSLMMEVLISSETSVLTRAIRRNIPEEASLPVDQCVSPEGWLQVGNLEGRLPLSPDEGLWPPVALSKGSLKQMTRFTGPGDACSYFTHLPTFKPQWLLYIPPVFN